MNYDKPDAATAFVMGVVCALIFILVDSLSPSGSNSAVATLLIIALSLPPMIIGLIGLDVLRKNPLFWFEGFTGKDYKQLAQRWALLIFGGIVVVLLATFVKAGAGALFG